MMSSVHVVTMSKQIDFANHCARAYFPISVHLSIVHQRPPPQAAFETTDITTFFNCNVFFLLAFLNFIVHGFTPSCQLLSWSKPVKVNNGD